MPLRAIIFDVGGVLVRTADQSLRRWWEQTLGLAPGEAERIVFGAEAGYAVQLGQISDDVHWRGVQTRLGLDDAALARFRQDFFCRDRLDADLLAYTTRLRGRYHVALLSNAARTARQQLDKEYGLSAYFDSITISGEEGVMKPAAAIFQIALARAGAAPAETVFVDDTAANIEAARRLGLQAIHFVDPVAARRALNAVTEMV